MDKKTTSKICAESQNMNGYSSFPRRSEWGYTGKARIVWLYGKGTKMSITQKDMYVLQEKN